MYNIIFTLTESGDPVPNMTMDAEELLRKIGIEDPHVLGVSVSFSAIELPSMLS